jgi:hypothetical protein
MNPFYFHICSICASVHFFHLFYLSIRHRSCSGRRSSAFLRSAVGAPNWDSVYYLPVVASLHDWELLTAASAEALERVLLVHFNNLDR